MHDSDHHIVLVDDDPFHLKLLTATLTNLGFANVSRFESGPDALRFVNDQPSPNLLCFVDLNMPGMDGVELVRNLVGVNFLGALVLVSGADARILDSAVKLANAHRLQVMGALHKPIAHVELTNVLQRWRDHHATEGKQERSTYSGEEVARAIAENELENYYQPKVEMLTGKAVGVETLVRWNHPSDGVVFPDQFVGVAEKSGLIEELTRCVLLRALRDAQRWRAAGIKLETSVNVSMDNLTVLDFPDFVRSSLKEVGVPPSVLTLEVTESRLMRDPIAVLEILTRLRLIGVGLSIDDFGTGHSSLVQLRDLPFGELKIDRSFVHGASTNTAQRAIVEANLTMARQLRMTAVGEGVEDQEDWGFLRERECDVAQGYFVAKPMRVSALGTWLEDWHRQLPSIIGP